MTPRRADVIVIGGGIAGAAMAFFASSEASIILVEAERQLAYHTTGRSAALFVENYGGPINERLAVASRSFLESHAEGHADFELLEPMGFLDLISFGSSRDPRHEIARSINLIPKLEVLDETASLELAPFLNPGYVSSAIWNPDASSLDVMQLHQTYVRGARMAGTEVHTGAGVRELSRVGGGWRAVTDLGVLEAPVIVNAAGAWADQIAQMAGAKPLGVQPLRRTAFTVGVEQNTRDWPFVSHEELPKFYFKPESGGQLLCSPSDETYSEPIDAKPVDIDIALAIEAINEFTSLQIRSVRSSWAGLRSFTPDRSPVVGWDPEVDGFFWIAGLGGTGINTSPATGMASASMVTGKPWPESLSQVGLTSGELAPGTSS